MDRLPFRTRARKRIWRDTLAFFKGRLVPLGIGIVGVIVAFLYNHFYLHTNAAVQLLELGLVFICSSYAIFFLGSLVVNTLRVPWLLDAESGQQIDGLEARAILAEDKADKSARIKQENARLHDLFGSLMQAGVDFSSDLARCQTNAHFASWDRHFKTWIEGVRDAIRDMGYKTYAVEFVRAGEAAEPIRGIRDVRNEQEERCRVLEQHQKNLAEFTRQRLP